MFFIFQIIIFADFSHLPDMTDDIININNIGRQKQKRRTQRNVNKAEEVPECINFSNREGPPDFL